MFKKLIIAVLTLGILLTFSSAAISSDTPKTGLNRLETFNPNAPRVNQATEVPRPTPSFTKPSNALNALLTPSQLVLPPDTFTWCEDYSGGAAYYFWRLTDVYGDSIMGMRFTSNADYTCTLKTASIGVYGTKTTGNAGMRVSVFDDDGFGFPGTFRGSVDVPAGNLPHSGLYYYTVDLSSLGIVYSDGAEFHIGASKTGVLGDTLAILSDDGTAGTGRSWEYYGVYGTMDDDWGIDVNFLIEACGSCARIPYTDCYSQSYHCGVAYFWRQPDAYGDDYFNMRFTTLGPETLTAVNMAVYRPVTKPWGNPDLEVFVWGDDGLGFPNLGDVIWADTIPWASLVFYPSILNVDLSALNIVLPAGEYHLGWSTKENAPGDTLACLSDNGSCGTGRSSEYWGVWGTMLDDWGADVNFLIWPDLCRDEFSDCQTLSDFNSDYYYWRYPDRYGDFALYQLFGFKGEGCRIDKVNVRFYWNRAMYAWPMYTTNSELQVWTVDGVTGLPDTKVYFKTVLPADYNAITPTPTTSTRWWKSFDIQSDNFRYDQNIWVGLESFAPDTLSGFQVLSDDGLTGGYRSCEGWGAFGYMLDDWGVDVDFGITLDVCCVPIAECACAPGSDWPAMGGNFARTGHSGNSLGNAQCNLTKAWEYVAGQVAVFNSPVIYKDTVICYFLDRLAAVDVNTGIQIWLRLSDPFVIGSAAYSTPTVQNGLIYTAGGSAKSFSALSVTTGATVWTRNFSTHSNHFVTFGPSVIVNVGGTDVVFYSDDFGWVYAVDALTGVLFPGWAINPVKLPQAILRALTTDGARLFVGTDIAAGSGDIYALDPATGAQLWQLSMAGGLQAATIVPPKDYGGSEGFRNAISVANEGTCATGTSNVIYTCSWYPIADNSTPVQQGGVLYSINAADGSLNWAILAANGGGGYSMPNIDASRIIHQSWPYWTTSGDHRGPMGVSRASGNVDWANTYPTQPYLADFPLMEGVLSCEEEVSDIFVGVYRSNFAKFFQADNGAPMFHRRFTGYLSGAFSVAGHRVAPVMDDGHLLLTWRNKIVALTNQVDRPRLELPHYVIDEPVEFGSPSNHIATFDSAIANSGCTPLQIVNITLDEISNNTTPLSAVIASANSERLTRLSTFVDNFNPKTDNWSLAFADETDLSINETALDKDFSLSNAAFAPPPYINSIVSPANGSFVAAGATIPLVLSVNGPMITRGRHAFYAYIETNDPDYFLDSALIDDPNYAVPQIELGLIGGCLYSSKRLQFGTTSSNFKIVWNSGFQADGDSSASFMVNGAGSQLWQGALVYAISKYRVALHAQNWHGVDFFWKSLLADPECVSENCPPQLAPNAIVGSMSTDNGANYSNVMANVMSFSYVDSMQNMDDDTSAVFHWYWAYPWDYLEDPPYDDTLTVGFKACVKVIGVTGNAAFNNFIIERHAVSARYGQAINNLYLTGMIDYDVAPNNARQMTGYDAAHSLAYVYDCGSPVNGWGYVKIPFGCGYEPMINAKTITASMGPWNDSDIWLDSLYYWASNNVGLSHQPGTDPCATDPDDRDAFMTFTKNSFSGSDSGIYAFANFGMPNITNADDASNYFGIANLANKFCGFGRGDVNNDGVINIVDIVYLASYVNFGGNGPFPFVHLGDVNIDGSIDINDVLYLKAFYFNGGACPLGKWEI